MVPKSILLPASSDFRGLWAGKRHEHSPSFMRNLILLCLLFTSSAHATVDERALRAMISPPGSGYSEQEIRREIAKGCGGDGDLAICAWYSYFQADVKLNDAYQKALSRLGVEESRESLRAAQKAWIPYRDASCRFETSAWEDGSFRYVATAMCFESMTRTRTKELAKILTCKGEDCPR